jgi:hypothetical protein
MKEFEGSLKRLVEGNVTLIDSIGNAQLAMQAAIRSSTSPEILNMFLKKENGSLRTRLASLDSDLKLGRISRGSYETQAVEILVLLDKLKEPLSPVEQELLRRVRFSSHLAPVTLSKFMYFPEPKKHGWVCFCFTY